VAAEDRTQARLCHGQRAQCLLLFRL
jgi:hypothetical protein